MRVILLAILMLSAAVAGAQSWTISASAPVSFDNVLLTPLTHTSYSLGAFGPIVVTSIVANGSTVVYTLNRFPSGTIVGDQVKVSTQGILTPGNPVPAGLLTSSCTVTAVHGSPVPYTITCASSTTATWTLTPPGVDQNPTTLTVGGVLWQWYSQGYNAGPSVLDHGKLYIRVSSTAATTFPPTWGTPFEIDTNSMQLCSDGSKRDVRIPIAGLMPNGDISVWFVAFCYTGVAVLPHPFALYFAHHDHTQAYNAGWTIDHFYEIPPGWANANFGCVQDSGRMNYDPTDGMPIIAIGGTNAISGSSCVGSFPWWVKTTDNGVTWSIFKSLFNGTSPPTFEFTLVNPSGNNWIGFLRNISSAGAGQFFPLYVSTSTDNGTTWTSWANSNIPASNICSAQYAQTTVSQYSVSPVAFCGNPSSSTCSMFYADRMGCSSVGAAAQMGVVFDPAQVLSSGAAYTATLIPNNLQYGIVSSTLSGYEYLACPTLTHCHLWWHGINAGSPAGADNLNIFQTDVTFTNGFIGSTIPGKSQITGGTAWQ